jgi:predicted Rossmann fold flavoprotein
MSGRKLIVIGGGAAGFFCAINAARMSPGLEVTILEKTSKLLSKVKVSGGGRCNLTHALFDIAEMSKRYPRGRNFVRKAFHEFFTTDTISWFEERGVRLKTEQDGRMFPVSDSSQTIVDCLVAEVNRHGVEIRLNAEVKELGLLHPGFELLLADGKRLKADFVCLACGGYPKISMFHWLANTGHTVVEPVPSLFTFNLPGHAITQLMGVSLERARVRIEGSKLSEEGPLLITHWGLSGPAVLRLSAWGARELAANAYHFNAHINWLPEFNEQSLKEKFHEFRTANASRKIGNQNFGQLPQRLWQFLLEQSGVKEDMRFADLPARTENMLIRNLVDYLVAVKGKTTFKEEFVTAGGIQLGEVDVQTMMSRKIANLFFAGEILDVDGITGGFNFQHAWTSGWIAARAIGEMTDESRIRGEA